MAQLLGFGTGTVNFFGRYAYVGEGRDGFHAVVWTEAEEPQAAIGSHLQKIAYPGQLRETHVEARLSSEGSIRASRARNSGYRVARRISLHREWAGWFRSFRCREHRSERFLRAHRERAGFAARPAHARHTKYATQVALPSTLALDPARRRCRKMKSSRSISFTPSFTSPIAKKVFVGLNVATLVDGNPDNNFLKRDVTFNPVAS